MSGGSPLFSAPKCVLTQSGPNEAAVPRADLEARVAAPHSDLALLSQQVKLALLFQRIQFALLPL
jgi:hypothetical protein